MFTLGIDAFSSRKEHSGVEWYTHHLFRAMEPETPLDWRVVLYSPDTSSNLKPKTSNLWQWKQLRWWPRRGYGQVRLTWEMLRQPPNVLFMPAAPIPLVHPHRPWRKQWTVTTIHDVEFLRASERYRPVDRRRQEFALSIALNHAARILVPSEATRAALDDRVRDDQVVVVPLGVDHTHYHPIIDRGAIDRVLAKYHITSPYVLYVGRIDAKKNLLALICAFAGLEKQRDTKWADRPKMCQFVLAGAPGFGAETVVREIQQQGLQDVVRLVGYVPEEDLPFLYNGAQAFAFPSLHEGFGLPVLQALACGTPAVIADTPALREVAGDAALVVEESFTRVSRSLRDTAPSVLMPSGAKQFAPLCIRTSRESVNKGREMWSEALGRILTDNLLRDTLRARGLERAKEFSWERTARETWQVIEDLVQ